MVSESRIENDITFCTFLISERLFGINILDIKEINNEANFTTINHAPYGIRGYVNIRGNLYLIADMRKIMDFSDTNDENSGKLIIFKSHIMDLFGIIVDEVCDTVTLKKTDVFDRRTSGLPVDDNIEDRRNDDSEISLGVVKLDKNLLIALNANKIIYKLKHI